MRLGLLSLLFLVACSQVPGPECKALLLAYDDACPKEGPRPCNSDYRFKVESAAKAGTGIQEERACHEVLTELRSIEETEKAKAK